MIVREDPSLMCVCHTTVKSVKRIFTLPHNGNPIHTWRPRSQGGGGVEGATELLNCRSMFQYEHWIKNGCWQLCTWCHYSVQHADRSYAAISPGNQASAWEGGILFARWMELSGGVQSWQKQSLVQSGASSRSKIGGAYSRTLLGLFKIRLLFQDRVKKQRKHCGCVGQKKNCWSWTLPLKSKILWPHTDLEQQSDLELIQ